MGKKLRTMGIRGRLICLILIVLVPILVLEAYIYYYRFHHRKAEELQANLELARSVSKTFDAFIQDILRQELTFGIAVTSSHPLSSEDFSRLLGGSVNSNPGIRSFAWSTPEGRVLASTIDAAGTDLSDRPYFREIVSGREWSVSPLVRSRETGEPIFVVSRAIRNREGSLLGVVVATLLPRSLDKVLALQRSGDAGISLFDNEGMHVYRHPAMELTWEQRKWRKASSVIGDVLKGNEIATTMIAFHGEKRLVAYTPVLSTGWVAAASRSEEAALANFTSALLFQALFTLLTTAAAFGAALLFSRTISRSMIDLKTYALALGRGELQKVPVNPGPKELRNLAVAFNEMAEQIRLREIALRESEERFRLMADTMPNLVWTAQPDGRVDYRSRYAFRYAGFPERGSGGEGKPAPVHPDDLKRMKEAWREAVQHSTPYQAECRVRRFDGAYRWHLSRGIPVKDESGCVKKWVGTATDVHDLREARSELELRVQERTAELEESESRLRALASELIKAQETERKRIAHELHDSLAAQLAAVKYRLERKLKDGESPENPVTLQEIIQDVQNANIETRRIMANLRPSILDDLGVLPALSWLSREMRKAYPGTIVEFFGRIEEQEVPEELKIVLFRIVQESVTNSIRHGRSGGVRIILERKESRLRLRVEDNGKGFDPARLAGPSETGGIGLNSMQQRVDSTGGIFSVTSTPGRGAAVQAEWRIPERAST